MQRIYTVTFESSDMDEAYAAMQLMEELGFRCKLTKRDIGSYERPHLMSETRLGKLVLATMEIPGKGYELGDFEAPLLAAGYKPNSAAPCLSKLCEEGKVKRIARGAYVKK